MNSQIFPDKQLIKEKIKTKTKLCLKTDKFLETWHSAKMKHEEVEHEQIEIEFRIWWLCVQILPTKEVPKLVFQGLPKFDWDGKF